MENKFIRGEEIQFNNDEEEEKESETDTDGLDRYEGDDDPCLYGKKPTMEDDEDTPVKKRKEYGLYDTEEEREDLEGSPRESDDYQEYTDDIDSLSPTSAELYDDIMEEKNEESDPNDQTEDDDSDDDKDKKYYFDEEGNRMTEDEANVMPQHKNDTGENGFIKYDNINELPEEIYKVDEKHN